MRMAARAICGLLTAGALLAASSSRAQHVVAGAAPGVPPVPACQLSPELARCARLVASVRVRFGLADAPYVTPLLPEVRGHGFVVQIAAALALTQSYAVGLRLPFAVISVEQPAGSYVDEATRGNLALFARRTEVWLRRRVTLAPFVELALGVPLAERDTTVALLAGRALAVASALEAYRQQEAFTAGTVPLAGSLGLQLRRGSWNAEVCLRLPLLLRFSRAGLPPGADTRSVGFTPSIGGSAGARPWPWMHASLAVDMVVSAVAPVAPVNETRRAQLSLTPALSFSLQEHVSLGVDFVAPIAGPLGGWNYSGSLDLVAAW